MPKPTSERPLRNDALHIINRRFGHTDRWEERVEAASFALLIAEEVCALRERHGLSQAALAKEIGSSQSSIARLENMDYRGHSISLLRRIAAAVGEDVSVRFVSAPRSASARTQASLTTSSTPPKKSTPVVKKLTAKKSRARYSRRPESA
jgi:transcriptional regulator with XRE-family HTH domain